MTSCPDRFSIFWSILFILAVRGESNQVNRFLTDWILFFSQKRCAPFSKGKSGFNVSKAANDLFQLLINISHANRFRFFIDLKTFVKRIDFPYERWQARLLYVRQGCEHATNRLYRRFLLKWRVSLCLFVSDFLW